MFYWEGLGSMIEGLCMMDWRTPISLKRWEKFKLQPLNEVEKK